MNSQPFVSSFQIIVLSDPPLSVIPPPEAVTSVAVPALKVTAPATGAVVAEILIAVSLKTAVIFAPLPNVVEAPLYLVTVMSTINPPVFASPLMVAVLPTILPTVPVMPVKAATLPISIFLSSTVSVLVLRIVVAPLTVRLPETTTVPCSVVVLVPEAGGAPITTLDTEELEPAVPILIVLFPLVGILLPIFTTSADVKLLSDAMLTAAALPNALSVLTVPLNTLNVVDAAALSTPVSNVGDVDRTTLVVPVTAFHVGVPPLSFNSTAAADGLANRTLFVPSK